MSKVSLAGNASGTGIFTIASPNSNTDRTLTLPDNTGTLVTQNSQPSFASTIGVGGATPSASGAGITFPATQSASSDANTLDDYEEGTFSPSIQSDSTGLFTMTAQYGKYTRVGNLVTFIAYIAWSARPSGGSIAITNYPFNINNGSTTGGNAATTFIVKSATDSVLTNSTLGYDLTSSASTTYVYNFARSSLIAVNSLSAAGFVAYSGSYFATN
jgi:hypothetical protein